MIPTLYRKPHPPALPVRAPVSWTPTGATLIDADAAAYIAAIEGYGETVTAAQKSAIDTFFRAGKSDGWYSSLSRLYLPIWGAAAPNARCLVSGTSGTFNGTVTHESGYVESDGSTGYFDPGVAGELAGLGIARNDCHQAVLVYAGGGTDKPFAANEVGGLRFSLREETSPAGTRFLTYQTGGPFIAETTGVFLGSEKADGVSTLRHISGAGAVTSDTSTQASSALPSSRPYMLARSINGAPNSLTPTTARIGAWSYGLDLTAISGSYGLALKTVWETCTGLTLP